MEETILDKTEIDLCCCKVESIISVDDRGQMVLPKDVRAKANIKPGDKLALVCWDKNGETQAICLIKVEALTGMVKDVLSPVMKDII